MQVCPFWLRGHCEYGKKCLRAHGLHELVPPNDSNRPPEESTQPKSLCPYWLMNGYCNNEECYHAHALKHMTTKDLPRIPESVCAKWLFFDACSGEGCASAHFLCKAGTLIGKEYSGRERREREYVGEWNPYITVKYVK